MSIKSSYCISLLLLALINTSCSNQEVHEHSPSEENTESHVHTSGDILLNDGARWQANSETTEGVNNMINIIEEFRSRVGADGYSELADTLKHEFTTIFQKCTMKGEAHNQLHNFLLPIKKYMGELDSAHPEVSETNLKALEEHLKIYSEYFE